jgi:putative ABC transport system ATP-binding protein
VKRPDILVIDGALSPFGETRADEILHLIMEMTGERTLAVVVPNERRAALFESVIRLSGAKAMLEQRNTDKSVEPDKAARHAAE